MAAHQLYSYSAKSAHKPIVPIHVVSMAALRKVIKKNRLFLGDPGTHSQTQARRSAAIGDCYVAK